jgi:hypothetical protein
MEIESMHPLFVALKWQTFLYQVFWYYPIKERLKKKERKKKKEKPELLPSFLQACGVGCRRLTPGPG